MKYILCNFAKGSIGKLNFFTTSQLTRQQKRENRRIGLVRVLVEHAIGGMKVFRVLTIRLKTASGRGVSQSGPAEGERD